MFETAKAVSSISVDRIHSTKNNIATTSAAKQSALQQLAASLVATSAAAAAAVVAASSTKPGHAFNVCTARNTNKTTTTNTINSNNTINGGINANQRYAWNHSQQQQKQTDKENCDYRENDFSSFLLNRRNGTNFSGYSRPGSTTEDLIPPGFSPIDKNLRPYGSVANAPYAIPSTIINESDFPQLGVPWSPSLAAGGGSLGASTGIDSPVNLVGGLSFGNNGNTSGLSMGLSTATSPMVSTSMANVHQQQQTSILNAMFMRDPMMHVNRPYGNNFTMDQHNRLDEILGKNSANGMYAKVTGGSLSRNSTVSLNPAVSNEFRMQNEDFPALPASQPNVEQSKSVDGTGNNTMMSGADNVDGDDGSIGGSQAFSTGDAGDEALLQQQLSSLSLASSSAIKTAGIQTHPDGLVTNIPANMLNDQYGMAGLLTFLRTIENDPAIIMLALGLDLTNLGLNLNSANRSFRSKEWEEPSEAEQQQMDDKKKNLHETFGGPWSDVACRIQDLEAKVPDEYLTNASIREQLPNVKLHKLSDDVLFYLFYNCPGEVYQVAAASELFQRDWRFHKTERVWLTRSPFSSNPVENTGSYEKSSYQIFDPAQWRKIPKEMIIEYKQLEGRPSPAVAAGSTAATNVNAPAPLPPPGMMGNPAGGGAPATLATRMMGMPMPLPLQAHAIALAQRQMAQQQQLHPALAVGAPPMPSTSQSSMAHGGASAVPSMTVGGGLDDGGPMMGGEVGGTIGDIERK